MLIAIIEKRNFLRFLRKDAYTALQIEIFSQSLARIMKRDCCVYIGLTFHFQQQGDIERNLS